MKIDILKVQKGPGIDQRILKIRAKAMLVDALKNKYSLPILLRRLELPKKSYYYQEVVYKKADKYADIRKTIAALFCENKEQYVYRRILGLLKLDGSTVPEKVVR